MSKRYAGFRTLTSPLHFHTAAIDGTVILAFQDGELIGSGRVSDVGPETLRIGNERFIIANCTFAYAD
ncbi:hypothetical protein [Paenibacillus sp. PAMC21692]|uniref:hypothetical protein n=1 Tax=Paenibacillus sp. PAMC21692 TaxID=2762320 RepID=UPI00164D3B7E|nr:hypothetical protein [Paenibacillus sp. PAMC21692]QNK54539.1 hypothetical protein H7F31_17915 [Paenibacillus sp. PAMC21692]